MFNHEKSVVICVNRQSISSLATTISCFTDGIREDRNYAPLSCFRNVSLPHSVSPLMRHRDNQNGRRWSFPQNFYFHEIQCGGSGYGRTLEAHLRLGLQPANELAMRVVMSVDFHQITFSQ